MLVVIADSGGVLIPYLAPPATPVSAVTDTTAPTAGTLSATATGSTMIEMTVAGASDNLSLSSTPYAFSTDGGTTWSPWSASGSYVATGLSAATSYACRHRVRDAAGNISTGATVNATTPASPLSSTWAFTHADGAVTFPITADSGTASITNPAGSRPPRTCRTSCSGGCPVEGPTASVTGPRRSP